MQRFGLKMQLIFIKETTKNEMKYKDIKNNHVPKGYIALRLNEIIDENCFWFNKISKQVSCDNMNEGDYGKLISVEYKSPKYFFLMKDSMSWEPNYLIVKKV